MIMRASLHQIETFYWVARLGGFHAAARHQHLTQPTISARIQELEDFLGAKLFERGRYRAELTPLGGQLLPRAEKILRLTDDFGSAAHQPNPLRGLLRLGTNESTAMAGLLELLTRLRQNYPAMRVELTIDIGSSLSRKLNAKELDVAILMDPVSEPHVIDEPIGRAELQWVASARRVLPKRPLTPTDLADMPIVLTPPPSALFNVATEWFRSGGCSLENVSSCNSISLIIQLVAAGHAVSVLPRSIVRGEVDRGVLQYLETDPPVMARTYYVSYLREEQGAEQGMLVQTAKDVLTRSHLLVPLPT
jgi:DNA-binding transcriptional LysR family regulator